MSRRCVLIPTIVLVCVPIAVQAAIGFGLVGDFQDSTTQGWAVGAFPVNAGGGQGSAGDRFLRIGGGPRMATYNRTPRYSGAVDDNVFAIQADLMRPAGDSGSLDMRIVLFGPGTNNRWTSTAAQTVPPDGVWRTYVFSMLEGDLTRVIGGQSYAVLISDVNRVMFRHDPGGPSSGGTSATGTLGIDNVTFWGDGIFANGFE